MLRQAAILTARPEESPRFVLLRICVKLMVGLNSFSGRPCGVGACHQETCRPLNALWPAPNHERRHGRCAPSAAASPALLDAESDVQIPHPFPSKTRPKPWPHPLQRSFGGARVCARDGPTRCLTRFSTRRFSTRLGEPISDNPIHEEFLFYNLV